MTFGVLDADGVWHEGYDKTKIAQLRGSRREMLPRVIWEHDEIEQPTLAHAIRRARRKSALDGDVDAQSVYQTMCDEILYSQSKTLSRERGIPGCVRCMFALCEEAVCL